MNTLTKQNSIDSKLNDETFYPEDDSDKLRRAMKGITTNQKAIIGIITNRTNHQRQELKLIYKKLFNRNLIDDLLDSLSENVKQTIYALMLTRADLNAYIFKNAIENTSLKTLVEYFTTQTNFELIQAKMAYKRLFNTSLEDDIYQHTQDNLALTKFFKYLINGVTPLTDIIDTKMAQKDLHVIFGNTELWFDEVINKILLLNRVLSSPSATNTGNQMTD